MTRYKMKFFENPINAPIGLRKLVYSMYVLHSVWMASIIGAMMAIVAVKWLELESDFVTNILEATFAFYGGGSSLALGIYAWGNIQAKKTWNRNYFENGNGQTNNESNGNVNIHVGEDGEEEVGKASKEKPQGKKLPPLPVAKKKEAKK